MAFLAALQFLTIAPPVIRRQFSAAVLGRSVGFFPLVGLVLGGLLFGLHEVLAMIWPAGVSAAIVLSAWVLLTGALHMDGLLDCCDGLFGGHTPDKRLQIMRDERVGAFAVVGGVLLLLIKYSTLAAAEDRLGAYLTAPALGRWGMALAIGFFPYARPEGLGRAMKDHAGWFEIALATMIVSSICWLAARERGLLAMAMAGGATWLAARLVLRRLPGLTGDVYGAICEVIEALVLLLFSARTLS